MRIISAPPPIETWRKTSTCSSCSTTVELEASDLYGFHSDQRDGSSVRWHCPTCKGECWIDAAGIPPMVIQKAQRSGP